MLQASLLSRLDFWGMKVRTMVLDAAWKRLAEQRAGEGVREAYGNGHVRMEDGKVLRLHYASAETRYDTHSIEQGLTIIVRIRNIHAGGRRVGEHLGMSFRGIFPGRMWKHGLAESLFSFSSVIRHAHVGARHASLALATLSTLRARLRKVTSRLADVVYPVHGRICISQLTHVPTDRKFGLHIDALKRLTLQVGRMVGRHCELRKRHGERRARTKTRMSTRRVSMRLMIFGRVCGDRHRIIVEISFPHRWIGPGNPRLFKNLCGSM